MVKSIFKYSEFMHPMTLRSGLKIYYSHLKGFKTNEDSKIKYPWIIVDPKNPDCEIKEIKVNSFPKNDKSYV